MLAIQDVIQEDVSKEEDQQSLLDNDYFVTVALELLPMNKKNDDKKDGVH